MTTSLIAVFLYGAGVKANLTQGLPSNLALYLDIGLITLQLFLSTIVGGCPLFQDIEDKLRIPKGRQSRYHVSCQPANFLIGFFIKLFYLVGW